MNKPLQEWFDVQEKITSDEMYYKEAFTSQIMFMRDSIGSLIKTGLSYNEGKSIGTVISEHISKSIRLPIYSFKRIDLGLHLIMRGNFYNWKLSVISERPIIENFSGLFYTSPPLNLEYTGDPLSPVYFDGFTSDLIFYYYDLSSDKKKWSAEIPNENYLFTTIFLIMRSLDVICLKN